jgi:hypothetical protein
MMDSFKTAIGFQLSVSDPYLGLAIRYGDPYRQPDSNSYRDPSCHMRA